MIVHGLDGKDSRCQSKLLQARHAVAGHRMYYFRFGLGETAGSLKLLTLGLDLELENQGAAERAKKALIFTTRLVPVNCWSQSRLKSQYKPGSFDLAPGTMFNLRPISRHAVGTSGRRGQ